MSDLAPPARSLREAELIGRLGWLVRLRWLAAGAILLGALVLRPLLASLAALRRAPDPSLIVVALVVLAYNLWLRAGVLAVERQAAPSSRTLHRLALLQIGLDLLALTVLIYFTGGVESPLAFFLVFHVILAGIFLRPALTLLVAGAASLLFAAVTGLEYAGLLPHVDLPLLTLELWRQPAHVLAANLAVALTLLAVAYLTGSIATRLRRREQELHAAMETTRAKSRELEELNARLQDVDRERTRFMTLVTHELRAPLSIIYSAMDVVLSGYASGEQAKEVLGRAQRRASELLGLVDDLLELTRARAEGSRHERPSGTHPGGPLRDVVEFMRVDAEKKGVALEVHVAPELPLTVAGADQMKLVWSNLLSNALKYTPPGGRVRVSLGCTPEQVVGTVEDTGIGIPAEDIPHVFDEFFRSSNARQTREPGTGIGLAVVRRLVANCGGTIAVESELNRGTRIQVRLPRADLPPNGR